MSEFKELENKVAQLEEERVRILGIVSQLNAHVVMLENKFDEMYLEISKSNVNKNDIIAFNDQKTPNELRKEIIENAKFFVRERTNGGEQVVPFPKGIGQWFLRNFCFTVNEEKRTVVVLCKGYDGKVVRHRAKAKCNLSDVFNEHIGKAIALGRALGIDVSEFENAIQPSKKVEGQIVKNGKYEVTLINDSEVATVDNNTARVNSDFAGNSIIIDDTNARY